MKTLLLVVVVVLLILPTATRADRITATITVTNLPADGNTLTFNSTRTWKTNVTSASTQIATANTVGQATTNLWQQIIANPLAGPVNPIWLATNQIQLRAANGQAVSTSLAGSWGTLTLSTQTVVSAKAVMVPLSSEPTPSVRTNIASQVVADLFNTGYSTTPVAAASSVMVFFVNLATDQVISGNKTLDGLTTFSNLVQFTDVALFRSNSTIFLDPGSRLIFGTNVTIYDSLLNAKWVFSSVESAKSVTTFGDITNKVTALLSAANAWLGTNSFALIANTPITAATITKSSYSGTVGFLTNGTWVSGTFSNAVHRGALQSYRDDASNVEVGSGAGVTNGFLGGVAIGQNARVGADNGTAVGNGANASFDSSTSIGTGATATEANQIRLGRSSEHVSVPGAAKIGGNTFFGDSLGTFAAGMSHGRQMTNGAAASADPANGVADFAESGEWKYRTSGTGEGAGHVNRVHNRGEQVTGSGSDFTIPDTAYNRVDFGGTDPQVSLPTSGTYLVSAVVSLVAGGSASDDFRCKLFDATNAADIPSSDRRITTIPASQTGQLTLQNIITVAGATVIQLYGQNLTAARGTIEAGRTSVTYVRLY